MGEDRSEIFLVDKPLLGVFRILEAKAPLGDQQKALNNDSINN